MKYRLVEFASENEPCAVESGNCVAIGLGMVKKLDKIITGDNSGWNNIVKRRHGVEKARSCGMK